MTTSLCIKQGLTLKKEKQKEKKTFHKHQTLIDFSIVVQINQTERKRRKIKIVKIQKYVQVCGNTNKFKNDICRSFREKVFVKF